MTTKTKKQSKNNTEIKIEINQLPKTEIHQLDVRQGGFGGEVVYIPSQHAIDMAIKEIGRFKYNWILLEDEIKPTYVRVKNRLEAYHKTNTIVVNGVEEIRPTIIEQVTIWNVKNDNIQNALKAAQSDAFKLCIRKLGIGLDFMLENQDEVLARVKLYKNGDFCTVFKQQMKLANITNKDVEAYLNIEELTTGTVKQWFDDNPTFTPKELASMVAHNQKKLVHA